MNKIDKDFELDKYGMHVRFVNEADAEYIVKLRSDSKLGKFLSITQNDIITQKQWIRDYKIREELGQEYYFFYSYQGIPVGVNRIYNINIKDKTATSGSWICSPNLPFELPFLTVILIREFFFELLQLETDHFDTRKGNKRVIRMHNILGAQKTGESDIDVFHCLTKEAFKKNKPKLLEYVGIKI